MFSLEVKRLGAYQLSLESWMVAKWTRHLLPCFRGQHEINIANIQIAWPSLHSLRDLPAADLCALMALLLTSPPGLLLSLPWASSFLPQDLFTGHSCHLEHPFPSSLHGCIFLSSAHSSIKGHIPPTSHITPFHLTLFQFSAQHLTQSDTVYSFTCFLLKYPTRT